MLTRVIYKVSAINGKSSEYDLSESQVYLLQLLALNGTMRCSVLAKELRITMPAVTNLANKLVRKGYIKRDIPEHDRRLIHLSLTELGQSILSEVNKQHADLMHALWKDFTEVELEQLLQALNKMDESLTAITEGKS